MIKSNSNRKHKLLKLCMAFLFPFTLFGGIGLAYSNQTAYADYSTSYEEAVTLTNSSFTQGSIASSSNTLTGWTAIETYSKAAGMIVDVGTGVSTDPDAENATFAKYQQTTYHLETNPMASGSDTRILMINSKTSSTQSNVLAQKGYRSNTISLDANSYYRFSVAVKTATNGDESVNASVYVSGLKDLDGQDVQLGYENITNSIWKEYYIFVATGNASQSVTMDLYLGSANGQSSYGAVFFDEVNVTRLSQNAFFDSCYDYGYEDADNTSFSTDSTRFLVSGLQAAQPVIDTTGYNFDFEDAIESDTNTLGDAWSVVSKSNGHAIIADIKNMQVSDFRSLTGYDYVGTDLSYGNTQALILYTRNNSGVTSGYVGVKSKDIEINAHEIYKISLKVKVSEITSGSFYLKVAENDKIYTLYPQIISDDSSADNYYALQSEKTSGISSNTTDNFTNDYKTISFYVKGHSLYNTSVNVELWLGDQETAAQGCVVVDDIVLEYSDYSSFSSASDKLELKSFTSSPSSITNGYFNSTEDADQSGLYPVKASGWTTEIESEKNNVSGVLYLYDQDTYNAMYSSYNWAGIYPGMPRTSNVTSPNNVYMMYNKTNSYQSITSSSYTLSSNNYYKLAFDYFTQDFSDVNSAKLKLEVTDENGIVLYSKSNISTNTVWRNMEIYFHTSETVSHNVTVKVYLGESDNKCGGLAYLDNFIFSTSTEDEFAVATNKADLNDYYLNLNAESLSRDITSSPAYNLAVDKIYDSTTTDSSSCALGGAVSGQDNPYMEINRDLQLEEGNYLALHTQIASKATLTSVYSLSLEAGKYYKLTFDLATIFNEIEDDSELKYGASVGLKGFDSTSYLVTNNELKSYTVYFKCDTATSSAIVFTLDSDCQATLGTALLTNIDFASVEENEYNNAQLLNSYNKSTFTVKQTADADEEEEEQEDEEESTDNSTNSSSNTWLLVPSIITAVAVVAGVIGWAFRHVKIKKIEKIKKESYDRKLSVNHDAILQEAQKRRDKEIERLNAAKKALQEEGVQLENEHKEILKAKQVESNGKLTKDMEKAFKTFNSQKHAINERINILNEKIENCSTAEYLLGIERKILAEQEDKFAKEKKERKLREKQAR